jgi:hypothetical protein
LAFFSKTNVMIKFFHNLTLFRVINAIFCWIFRRKYLKNHNIGPWPLVRKTLNDCPPFNQSVPYKEPISRKTLSIFDRQKFERKKWCIDFCPPQNSRHREKLEFLLIAAGFRRCCQMVYIFSN